VTRGRNASAPTIVVLGGAGAMGRIAARDLCASAADDSDVVVADVDRRAARALVARLRTLYPRARLTALELDVTRAAAAARAIDGTFGLINCCHHDFNLAAMEVALRAGCHYVDLGGLFHVTRRQLKLHARFKACKRLAVLGMGAAPGIVNVLARAAADEMEQVHEVHIAVAGIDRAPPRADRMLASSYSLQTVLDEASLPAAVFAGGRFRFVPPMSDPQSIAFPPPVGTQSPSRTIHSEVATLPLSFRKKGIREVSFRIAFAPDLERHLRFLSGLGLLSRTPIRPGRQAVAPRDVIAALLQRLPAPAPAGVPDEHEILRVVVRGQRTGAAAEDVLECHAPGIPAWGVGVDADTGCPPSIVMQMIARGDIAATGVRAPETVVPADALFRELERRGMRVEHRRGIRG